MEMKMDEKRKEELAYHLFRCTSIIAVPLEDGDYMFLFRSLVGPDDYYEKRTSSSWKKWFFSTTKAVFYRGEIITKVKKICNKHLRKIIESPEILKLNLYDDKIRISSPQYVTPIKNLMREHRFMRKRGRLRKYRSDKVEKVQKTYYGIIKLGNRITKEQQEILKGKNRALTLPEISAINKKLKIGDFHLVKGIVFSGIGYVALRRTSRLEDVPLCQLRKMLYSQDYRERTLKRFSGNVTKSQLI